MKKYIPSTIESKWQKKWEQKKLYAVDLDLPAGRQGEVKKKYYLLVEFTYPSGDLHIGHWFAFAVPDVLGRLKRMQGYNVFFPNGFDAFGLPAENAAIQKGVHPRDWTLTNIENMKKQFSLIGAIHNFENEVITCLPDYYKWNQWIFLKMLDRGIAYRGKALANWCPNCQTVLANENVEVGKCWRCGTEIVQKEVDQWFLKITDYADRLLWPDNPSVDWPKPIREGQNNWIGKKEGINITYRVISDKKIQDSKEVVEVFTTRPDTNYGATFIALAPEHPLVLKITTKEQKKAVDEYIKQASKKTQLERQNEREKTGVFTGSYAINDLTGYKMPIWVSDFVLMGVGTGALVGVPGHDKRDFEFAKKFDLEIIRVVIGKDDDKSPIIKIDQVQEEEGTMINSDFLNGMDIHEATKKIMDYMEEKGYGKKTISYHLHDWSISRQRYWGTPIPIINCPKCGVVPVPVKDLPLELPYKVDWAPKGKPPLATAEDWINVKCPKCGGEAKREVETMDTFFDSSWYFLRYLDHKNDKEIVKEKRLDDWMPVDIYFGGAEHTLGHMLYSRFFVKFLKDIGVLDFEEYAKIRVNHGVILGPDGQRMSKSHGNVVNPEREVKQFGADTIRLYLCFIGPYDIVAPWNPGSVHGVYHFLQRVWGLQEKIESRVKNLESRKTDTRLSTLATSDLKIMHKTIKKVTKDIEQLKFNTPVASLMEWLNHLSRKEKVSMDEYKTFLLLLAPFAPHITEELWSLDFARDKQKWSIHQQSWPKFDTKYLVEEEVTIVVQVNGKVRDSFVIKNDLLNNSEVIEKRAKESENTSKFLQGKTIKKVVYVHGKIINLVV